MTADELLSELRDLIRVRFAATADEAAEALGLEGVERERAAWLWFRAERAERQRRCRLS